MLAARDGHYDEVKRLLREGADPDERNVWGWTAVMFASANVEYRIRNLLKLIKYIPKPLRFFLDKIFH